MNQWEKSEFYILLVTILIGGLVSILDLIGGLDSIDWLKDRIPTITLLMVALIAGSLLVSMHNYRRFMESVLPFGTVRRLDGYEEQLSYIVKRIKQARKCVYDITWAQPFRSLVIASDRDRDRYIKAIESASDRILYHEITMFCGSQRRADKVRRLLHGKNAGKYFELAVYSDLPEDAPPRWQFLIIDKEEVILPDLRLSVKQPEVVDYFCRFYEALWDQAEIIGSGEMPDSKEKLEAAIERSLSANP
jgi:hypothetical protein